MSDDITGDLDLLGDWLDAKGYTEEAGLCTRAMDEINKLREERDLWISRFEDFRKNAARLEEARSRPMRLVGSTAAAALKDD